MKNKFRIFVILALLVSVLISCKSANTGTTNNSTGQHYFLFVGTFNPADSVGISVFDFDTHTGEADLLDEVSGIEDPTFMNVSPDHKFLYAVSETHNNFDGQVFSYAFDDKTGKLSYLNQQLVQGNNPCYIRADSLGNTLFVANYLSGNVSVLPINEDGTIGKLTQNIQHHGRGPVSPNQDGPHVHSTVLAPNNKDLFVTDLGVDKIFTYAYDEKTGKLSDGKPASIDVTPGSGPRHTVFSPDGKFLYLIQELGGQVSVFKYENGGLKLIQEISNLPKDYNGRIWAGDIHLSPDGKFLYATNRDDLNDIVTYKVDTKTGKIKPINRQPVGGKTPRYFGITPDGRYVLVGQQNGKVISVFKRNSKTGLLTRTKNDIPVAHAVYFEMIPR